MAGRPVTGGGLGMRLALPINDGLHYAQNVGEHNLGISLNEFAEMYGGGWGLL